MSEIVEIHGDQWKLSDIQENIEWGKQQSWEYKKYDNPSDHEHCLICYWTIFEAEGRSEGYGYFFEGSIWLCTECYGKFIEKL